MNTPQETTENSLNRFDQRTQEVLKLAMDLCREPGVSMPQAETDFEALERSAQIVRNFAKQNGLKVYEMPSTLDSPYPHVVIAFNDDRQLREKSDVALVGHIDVVKAQSENQFDPRIEGDMLIGRGTADMKTVVATQLVWMAEQQAKPGPKPSVITMVSTCEENGSTVPSGTQHALKHLLEATGTQVKLAIVGERTGEIEYMRDSEGNPPQVGPICEANRGWRWYRAEGTEGISGMAALKILAHEMKEGRQNVDNANNDPNSDRMREQDNWRSSFTNSFTHIGPDEGLEDIEGQLITFTIPGEPRHAASFSTGVASPLERFCEIAEALSTSSTGKVKLAKLKIGEDHNYNTVTGGGEMVLAVENGNLRVLFRDVIGKLHAKGVQVSRAEISRDSLQSLTDEITQPVFGMDIREVPEHASVVNMWRDETRNNLRKVGIELDAVNEGPGWECPSDNPHYQKLMRAYEQVIGEPSPPTGKLHGNDGRFFDGDAVVFGQTGINPHGPKEGHYIPSIIRYLEILDKYAE